MTQDELADALVAAHDGGVLIAEVPEALVPADMDAVYALQDKVIARLGAVGGWKVAAGTGDAPICAPIPANRYFDDKANLDGTRHRFVLAEIEVAVTLGADIPAGADRAAVEAAIASVHGAIELIGSPFVDRDAMPRNLLLGDLQSNGAVVVGPAIEGNVRGAAADLPVSLLLDGTEAHKVEKGASWDQILDAIAWLAGHAAGRGLPLKAGHIIITGARALKPLNGAKTVQGRLGELGSISAVLD